MSLTDLLESLQTIIFYWICFRLSLRGLGEKFPSLFSEHLSFYASDARIVANDASELIPYRRRQM
jgi:hypothetical protein